MVKIAIVEDETAIAKMYEIQFKKAGYTVEIANDGITGLALCERMKPDLILLDLMMPEMSGQEVLEKIRAMDWGKDTLVMVLTNLSQREADMRLGKSGFDEYAVKAYYTPKQILEKVNKLLKDNNKLPKE
jgi:two-component system alkaline phosphatase synthesis response regulator PhoP